MPEEAPRSAKSVEVDGQKVEYLSPADQAKEDRRQAERTGLSRSKSLRGFFRMFRIQTRDRP